MWLAYNTNGLAHHRLDDALRLLADVGYDGVALTPDVGHLDLLKSDERDWENVARRCESLELRVVVETGARFVLDPRRKHWPNLMTKDDAAAEQRIAYYRTSLRIAQALGAECVSIWSGAADDAPADDAAWARLVPRLRRVVDDAAGAGVPLCFEPEPGMWVDSLARYRELRRRLARPDLVTTLDIGHLLVTESGLPQQNVAEFAESLKNVQLDDARRGVHEHLPLGEGEIDFPPVLAELKRIGYGGPLALELSRDSHRAAQMSEAMHDLVRRWLA